MTAIPTPDTTKGVFVLVTGLWGSSECRPCKRLANTSGPMGDAGRRHECPDAPNRRRGVPSRSVGAPGNAVARWVEAVNSPCRTHRGSGSFAGGALSSFPRRMARCRPTPWLRSFCNPDTGPATCARCR